MLYKLPGNYRLINFGTKHEAVGSGETRKALGGSSKLHIPYFYLMFLGGEKSSIRVKKFQ